MIAAGLATGAGTCQASVAAPPVEGALKISVISGRPVVDGVYLNGQGPFRFLIDTGAQTNQVETRIARRLNLKATFRTELATVAGSGLVEGGRMEKVSVGAATAMDQEFLFTGLEGIHALSASIQGVVGQEFLSRFDYLLDFTGHRIVFGASEPEGGSRTALDLSSGRPRLDTDKGRLILDSGAEIAILYGGSINRTGSRVLTASGSAPVSEARDLRFRVAGQQYSTVAAAIPRASSEEDGVVPASVFRAVYVSNSGKFVVLNPSKPSGK